MVKVWVTGEKEWQFALKRLEASLPTVEKDSGTESAILVAARARALVPIGPGLNGHVKSTVESTGSTVHGGGFNFRYFGWLEFGGAVGKNNSVRRPWLRSGRYIYRSYREQRPIIEEKMEDALESAIRRSGLR